MNVYRNSDGEVIRPRGRFEMTKARADLLEMPAMFAGIIALALFIVGGIALGLGGWRGVVAILVGLPLWWPVWALFWYRWRAGG